MKLETWNEKKKAIKLNNDSYQFKLQDGGSVSSYVSAGGPGQNFIEVTARLFGVTHFKYTYDVYGNNSSILIPSFKLLLIYILYVGYLNRK